MQQPKYSQPSGHYKSKYSNHPSKREDTELNSQSDSQPQTTQNSSTVHHSKQQQLSIEFKDSPLQMKCPFCLQNVRTEIILKPEFISILLGFALFVVLPNFIMLIFTLVILQITSTRKHRCPLCERELGSDGKFLVFFKDEVYSFVLGTNGIIISKKILTSVVIGIVIFVFLSIRVNNAYADATFTDMSWPQFSNKCPYDSKDEQCLYGNEGLTVKNWKGYVMRVQDNRNTIKRHFQYAVSVYLKMNDPQSMMKFKQTPDLFLTITSFQANQWEEQLDKLSHGDQIEFNATFQYLRNSRNIPVGRHLNIIEFNQTGKHNPDIHVYMSEDEDSWFFQNLSGQKLRKHEEGQTEDSKISNDEKAVEKQVQAELNKAVQSESSPTQKQKQVVGDQSAANNPSSHPAKL